MPSARCVSGNGSGAILPNEQPRTRGAIKALSLAVVREKFARWCDSQAYPPLGHPQNMDSTSSSAIRFVEHAAGCLPAEDSETTASYWLQAALLPRRRRYRRFHLSTNFDALPLARGGVRSRAIEVGVDCRSASHARRGPASSSVSRCTGTTATTH